MTERMLDRERTLRRAKDTSKRNLHAASRKRALAKILKAGEVVFGRRGFDGATTAEIAKEAGVAKATVHYYFKTKKDLHKGVLDRILHVWADALNEIDAAIEKVRDGTFTGESYEKYASLKAGGAELAPLGTFEGKLPAELVARVRKRQDEIKSGAFEVQRDDSEVKSSP